jgi:ubiquinone/menaquinone biosynthesis C-methylase UbiE
MIEEIKNYYDNLAKEYDTNRFENSYGRYIDSQERLFLKKSLVNDLESKILDLGCGTGRFLNYAGFGVDISEKMIEVAKEKFPNKTIKVGSLSDIPFDDNFFDVIYSFHVIMHLNKEITQDFLTESHKKLNMKGKLIFDFPSKKRRNTTNYKAKNWHAANSFTLEEIKKMTENNWKLKHYQGILFFPLHRLPRGLRKLFVKIDNLICSTFLREYSSYIFVALEKI